jgi:hypothetical protein
MATLSVKKIVENAVKIVVDFTTSVANAGQEELLAGEVEHADSALGRIYQLQDDFHKKIERFGAKMPPQYLDGHDFSVRNRCLGDGRDPKDCGRWFVKVGASYI